MKSQLDLIKVYLGIKKLGFYSRYFVAVNDNVIAQFVDHIKALNSVKFICARNSHLIPENGLTYRIDICNLPARFCKDIELYAKVHGE